MLTITLNGPSGTFNGRIENTRIAPLDPDTLAVDTTMAGDLAHRGAGSVRRGRHRLQRRSLGGRPHRRR
nr:hypothetical protein [uncultured Brevundimonas sp.]